MTISCHPLAVKFENELATRRSTLGNDHIDVAETLNALALVNHYMTDDQEEALRCHTEALHIFNLRKNTPDYSDANVALTLSDIGNVYRKRGNYIDAASFYMKSVQTYRLSGMNDEHPRVHAVLMCLAQVKGFVTEVKEEPVEIEPQQECPSSTEAEEYEHLPLLLISEIEEEAMKTKPQQECHSSSEMEEHEHSPLLLVSREMLPLFAPIRSSCFGSSCKGMEQLVLTINECQPQCSIHSDTSIIRTKYMIKLTNKHNKHSMENYVLK
mmetsp:Transcript_7579/g.11122  ORF Transcript_7579/g.11122 Transcript_7579/m.11122 type:complete len:269 (-) Transcript_7579:4-810(-)